METTLALRLTINNGTAGEVEGEVDGSQRIRADSETSWRVVFLHYSRGFSIVGTGAASSGSFGLSEA